MTAGMTNNGPNPMCGIIRMFCGARKVRPSATGMEYQSGSFNCLKIRYKKTGHNHTEINKSRWITPNA